MVCAPDLSIHDLIIRHLHSGTRQRLKERNPQFPNPLTSSRPHNQPANHQTRHRQNSDVIPPRMAERSFCMDSRSCMSPQRVPQTPFRSFLFTDSAGPREGHGLTRKQTSGQHGYTMKRDWRMFELRHLVINQLSMSWRPITICASRLSQINFSSAWSNSVTDTDLFIFIILI
jgi:hypothetical protein